MKNLRDITLILAGFAVIFALGVATDLSDWLSDLDITVDTNSTPTVDTPTITTTVALPPGIIPTLSVAPQKLVFHGERKWPWEKDVNFGDPILLTIAEAEDKTITLLHPPVYSPNLSGQANLIVEPETCETPKYSVFTYSTPSVTETVATTIPETTGSPTATIEATLSPTATLEATPTPAPPIGPGCYNISVSTPISGGLALSQPGTYSSTIHIGAGEDSAPTSVDVEVRIHYWLLWPVLTVALGVLATEFLVWWGKRWAHYSWNNRRVQWRDLLSEEFEWATMFENEPQTKAEAARQVRVELKKHLGSLSKQLAKVGTSAIADIPTELGTARENVYAFKQTVDGCLEEPWDLDHLKGALAFLKDDKALENAKLQVKDASTQIKALRVDWDRLIGASSKYSQLEALWGQSPPNKPDHETLVDAWRAIGVTLDKVKELKQFALPKSESLKSLSEAAEAVAKLEAHLKTFRTAVIEVAEEQHTKVKDIQPAPQSGKPNGIAQLLTLAVLKDFATLAHPKTPLEQAEKAVSSAKQPLRDSNVVAEFNGYLTSCQAPTLEMLGEEIASLTPDKLKLHVVRQVMFKPVRESLKKADEDMAQPQTDMKEVWERLSLAYGKDRRFVKVGRQLKRTYDNWGTKDEIRKHIERAYQLLLSGDALGAEIELERAESKITSMWKESLKGSVRGIAERKRPAWVGDLLLALAIAPVLALAAFLLLRGPQGMAQAQRGDLRWVWAVILALVPIIWLLGRALRAGRLGTALGELFENVKPWLINFGLRLSSQLLTIAVAVALIIVGNSLANIADTWGRPLDFVTAFTWGVVANRAATPLQSLFEKVRELLKPEKKEIGAAESSEESGKGETEQS